MVIIAAVLYAAATAVLLVFGLNLLWLTWRHRAQGGLQASPVVPEPTEWPHVTIQLPLFNERFVVERLIDATAQLDYPTGRLEIQVLDDSTDDTRRLAAKRVALWQARGIDIKVVTRPDRRGFKAGALAYGLPRARGTFVAIFDADFIPPRDFLRRTVPLLAADEGLGLVQARWDHLNDTASVLTRVQAALLDTHFVIEQDVRSTQGLLMNFNGTAGLWRRACIADAGGWQSDTLTEDLDLSYRAQLRGWRFRYLADVTVPAEIPDTVAAWRQQQFRWTKGTAETARKLLRPLWRSSQALGAKVQGTLHLTGFLVYPAILTAVLLHAPLLVARAFDAGPGDGYFAAMGLGIFAFAGVLLAHAAAQRALYTDWKERMRYEPFLLAASLGLSIGNTQAVGQALRQRRTPFVRTPKVGEAGVRTAYARRPDWGVVWAERLLAVYSVAGLVALIGLGQWPGVGFQALFVLGFGLLGFYDARKTGAHEALEPVRPRPVGRLPERAAVPPAVPVPMDVHTPAAA
ncbi:MAG: glycosyltransferase [Rhodothermaceae bacterium]|nr:glycosyltransferase [Rhodothermaceae bacterium]